MSKETMDKGEVRKKLREGFFYHSGYSHLNGGYAEIPEDGFQLAKSRDGKRLRARGTVTVGVQDMGSGHSESSTDEFDVCLEVAGEDRLLFKEPDFCSDLDFEE
jgi:hypothetical protein